MTLLLFTLALTPRADMEIPATVLPLGKLVPEIAQRANMKLAVDASVASDVIGIASPKTSHSRLLEAIARAANATWESRVRNLRTRS